MIKSNKQLARERAENKLAKARITISAKKHRANRGLNDKYNAYLRAKRSKETMQARYLYTAYRKAGGKRYK